MGIVVPEPGTEDFQSGQACDRGSSLVMCAPGSRIGSNGKIGDKSGRTFQPGQVMQWTASRGSGRARENIIPELVESPVK